MTEAGGTVESGGTIRANQRISLEGGQDRDGDGKGVKMPGGARVATANEDGEIYIKSP